MTPEKLGKYKIIRLLREGGMSKVFEAEHAFLKKKVAVKVLNNYVVVLHCIGCDL